MTIGPLVLVAEDDAGVRRLIVRRLRSQCPDCEIVEAADGIAALALIESRPIGGIVTDYLMPGATGLEVLAAARARSAELPVVMLSAHGTIAHMALQHGATMFLDKPFFLADLDNALRLMI